MISSFYNRIPNSFVVISRSLRNRVPLPARIRKSSKITLNSNKSSKLDSTEILNENIDSNLVHIKNSQRLFPIDEEEIRTQVKLIQRHLKVNDVIRLKNSGFIALILQIILYVYLCLSD